MELLNEVMTKASDYLWNVVLIVLLCGTGIYYTIRLKFVQVRKFKEGLRLVFGHMVSGDKTAGEGEMTPFQSVATAIAAQVGTGNLTGAATALLSGGPGAIFWMWLSAFFGMATIYAEAVLAQEYRTTENGEVTGGPVYYIRAAFRGTLGKVLAGCFAVFIIVALGFCGNMVQSNSIGSAFSEVFAARGLEIPPVTVGLVLAAIAAFIFLGGVGRLASVVEKMVPFMAAVYIVGSLALIILHIGAVPEAIRMILAGAFSPEAVLGAGAGITIR
ncbi:MAG TPA: sodium:alanine symporter family protein, partial [Candidatus Caccovicinus merdipullorum]|nr:sodium:alanine symporter family protein [Candidatus Caccovicinus merdipullorum]